MNIFRIGGVILFVLGVLALTYGGFTYTEETHQTNLGPLSLSVDDKESISIPLWAGIGAVLIGGILFFGTARR